MQWPKDGKPLAPTREGLTGAFPAPSTKVVVLVHGLCMNDLQWTRQGHNHGAALARDLGYTPAYLHYNTGLRRDTTDARFPAMHPSSPVADPGREPTIVAHSMGGRSRGARTSTPDRRHASAAAPRGLPRTPHHGAALARGYLRTSGRPDRSRAVRSFGQIRIAACRPPCTAACSTRLDGRERFRARPTTRRSEPRPRSRRARDRPSARSPRHLRVVLRVLCRRERTRPPPRPGSALAFADALRGVSTHPTVIVAAGGGVRLGPRDRGHPPAGERRPRHPAAPGCAGEPDRRRRVPSWR